MIHTSNARWKIKYNFFSVTCNTRKDSVQPGRMTMGSTIEGFQFVLNSRGTHITAEPRLDQSSAWNRKTNSLGNCLTYPPFSKNFGNHYSWEPQYALGACQQVSTTALTLAWMNTRESHVSGRPGLVSQNFIQAIMHSTSLKRKQDSPSSGPI